MAELEINTSDVVKLSIFTEIFLLHPRAEHHALKARARV